MKFLREPSFCLLVLILSACSLDQMADKARIKPLEPGKAFVPVEGTIARGQLKEDPLLWTGKEAGKDATHFPFVMSVADLKRGQERFNIHCSPCHGRTGEGNGMIVQRGFSAPPSYFVERLKQAPPGYLFQVASFGFGAMPSYSEQIDVQDRWRIVAYIKALQTSRRVPVDALTPEEKSSLKAGGSP